MIVLMFSGLSPAQNTVGCGWITGLLARLRAIEGLQVIYGYISDSVQTYCENNVIYKSIAKSQNKIDKVRRYFYPKSEEANLLSQMKKMVDECSPDIIHVFGSETIFGLISQHTTVPVVVHLQGLMIPYINAWYPNGYSKTDLSSWNEKRALRINEYYAEREEIIFHSCKYYMGRTDWDYRISQLYSPTSKYYHCEEMLRPEFYTLDVKPKTIKNKQIRIVSVLSSPLYKGHDMILKTAYLLKNVLGLHFEWIVLGYHSMGKAEKKLNLSAKDLNIQLVGRKEVNELIDILNASDVFVHPSYIDNSPNSICEAQYLGIPVIACNAGGVSSLIQHEYDGFLVPCNDPYMTSSYIQQILNDSDLYYKISKNATCTSHQRHSQGAIIESLIDIYNDIVGQ